MVEFLERKRMQSEKRMLQLQERATHLETSGNTIISSSVLRLAEAEFNLLKDYKRGILDRLPSVHVEHIELKTAPMAPAILVDFTPIIPE